jgi:hypothetical protein
MLREEGKNDHPAGIPAALDIADRLPVQTHQLCKALLCDTRLKSGGADISADDPERSGLHTSCCARRLAVDIEDTLT